MEENLVNVGTRFAGADWYSLCDQLCIEIVGAGGIGSWTALQLSRLTPGKIILYDDDDVDSSNLSGQFFRRRDIGQSKVGIVASLLEDFSNFFAIETHKCRANDWNTLQGTDDSHKSVCIAAVDNMEARKELYNSWKAHSQGELFIDGRLAAEKLQVFAFTSDNNSAKEAYERNWLFSDDEADPTVCSYKQTSFCASMIGSIITNIVINYLSNYVPDNIMERPVPFLTEYDAKQMLFNVDLSV